MLSTVCKVMPYLYTEFFTFYMKVVRLVLFFCVCLCFSWRQDVAHLGSIEEERKQHFYHKEVKTAYLWSSPSVCVCDSWPAGALCDLFCEYRALLSTHVCCSRRPMGP